MTYIEYLRERYEVSDKSLVDAIAWRNHWEGQND